MRYVHPNTARLARLGKILSDHRRAVPDGMTDAIETHDRMVGGGLSKSVIDTLAGPQLPKAFTDAIEERRAVLGGPAFSRSVMDTVDNLTGSRSVSDAIETRKRLDAVDSDAVRRLTSAAERVDRAGGRRLLEAAVAAKYGADAVKGPNGVSALEVAKAARDGVSVPGLDAATVQRVEQARRAQPPRTPAIVDRDAPLIDAVRELHADTAEVLGALVEQQAEEAAEAKRREDARDEQHRSDRIITYAIGIGGIVVGALVGAAGIIFGGG